LSKKEFIDLLRRLKSERILSSEADKIFAEAIDAQYCIEVKFLQFTSVFGRQIDSKYDNGFKSDCVVDDTLS